MNDKLSVLIKEVSLERTRNELKEVRITPEVYIAMLKFHFNIVTTNEIPTEVVGVPLKIYDNLEDDFKIIVKEW